MQTKIVKQTQEKKLPTFTLRSGQLRFAVWENKTKDGNKTFKTFEIQKSHYDDQDKEWIEDFRIKGLNRNDALNLSYGCQRIIKYLVTENKEEVTQEEME